MTTLAGIPQATVPAAAPRACGVYGTSTGTTAWGRPGTSLGMSHAAIRLFDVANHPTRRPPGTS
ncbi:MAG: hypothetical protein H0V33_04160 [Acidimicrobiia bacterium]|jgi:hypothetical protein|nr:hypothetical protein [Acidimicrobiia bacterium]